MACVEILDGPAAGKRFTFKDEVELGRSSQNAIPLPEPTISRRHARITRQGSSFLLEDLASRNGTRVRAQRLEPATPYTLQDGDEIRVGATRLLFHLEAGQQPLYDPGQGFFNTVTAHPRLFLLAALLFAACFVAFIPRVKFVDNVDYITVEGDDDVQFYKGFKDVFGNDEFFVIAFEEDDIFTKKHLTMLKEITDALAKLEEVREIKSLANVNDAVGGRKFFEVKKFLAKIPEKKADLDKLKKQATRNPLYVKHFISPDARTAALMVFTYDRPEDGSYRKRLLAKTEAVLAPYRQQGHRFFLAGITTTNLSLSQYMLQDLATFIPANYLLIILTIWLVFRNLRLTLLAVANISVCMASTMGLFGLLGITINNVTTIVIPLIMALCLADTMHIFARMDIRVLKEFPNKYQAMASVLRSVVAPCFLTTVTTAIGFAALVISDVPPIRQFGYIAAAGMVFEFVFGFFLMPSLILLLAPEKVFQDYQTPTRGGMASLLHRINALVQHHNRWILLAVSLLVCACGWFATQLRTETNLIEYFKPKSSVRTSIDFVEKRLGGVSYLDISLKATEDDAFKMPAHLKTMETLQQHIKTLEGVDVTLSLVDFIKDMHESFNNEDHRFHLIPDNASLIAQYLLLYNYDDIDELINAAYDHARILIRTSKRSSAGQAQLINAIKAYIDKMPHPGLTIRVTGLAVNYVKTIDALVDGQINGLVLEVGVIAVIMCVALRSLSLGLVSLLPNMLPIILNFGIMGAFGIPIDNSTAMVSSIAFGMAIDNTIHFLSEFRKLRADKRSIAQAVEEILLGEGRAVISASLILCAGFAVLMLANFVPTINYGMLSTIMMLVDIIGDLFFLPALILLRRR